jgi:hypothetical protein
MLTFELPGVVSRKEIQLHTTKRFLELSVSDLSCGIAFII